MKYFSLLLIIGISTFTYGTETRMITESNYNSIWLWQLSNTTVTQEKGIGLSRQHSKKYTSSQLLWTGESINETFYLGTAETAKVIKLDADFQEQEIFYSTNHSIIGSIAPDQEGLLIAASPNSALYHLDDTYTTTTNTSLSNSYIWDIVPSPQGGFYILTGLHAEVYEYQNNTLSQAIAIETEEHLLKGIVIDETLWVLGEKALYRKSDDRFIAHASFPGTASSMTYHNGQFYIIYTITKESSNGTPEQITSTAVSVDLNGTHTELYTLQGLYFTSISVFEDQLVIGADQFGFYAFYDPITKKTSYSSLGQGKILEIFSINNSLNLLSSDNSGLWVMDKAIAPEGHFISEVYDTKNVSDWGMFSAQISAPTGTGIQFYIQTGVTENPNYWEDWQVVSPDQTISNSASRYIRYKAVLKSSGENSPYVHSVSFPYVQKNLSPVISNVQITQEQRNTTVSWSASDPNEDSIEYDLFLAQDGYTKIKINALPLTDTNYVFDHTLYPPGDKKITLIASDNPSNSDQNTLTASYTSLPIMFDGEAPTISDLNIVYTDDLAKIVFTVEDLYSTIKEASYTINGTHTVKLQPTDGVFDSRQETFEFTISVQETTMLQVQVSDYINNSNTKGTVLLPQ